MKKKKKRKVSRRVSDKRWEVALCAADDGDLRELVRALLIVAPIPNWVRDDLELTAKFKDERPLKDTDLKLLRAVRAYRVKSNRRPRELTADFEERMAREHGVKCVSLHNYNNCQGGTYQRLHQHSRKPQQ